MDLIYLECPCCGNDGAVSDEYGEFEDGQILICGCLGWVSADGDEMEPWINVEGCHCEEAINHG